MHLFEIPGFNQIYSNRKNKNGGGILIYIKKHFSINVISSISNYNFD